MLAAALATGSIFSANAAVVGVGGYTNAFTLQPAAVDWSTLSIGTGNGDYSTTVGLDAAVQGVAAGSINLLTMLDAGDPPPILGSAAWSSTGSYLQTRPTGNGATLLLCTLVNRFPARR